MLFIAEEVTIAGKGPGLYLFGDYITPSVHEKFTQIMRDNWMHSKAYRAVKKCHAFFQGGSESPNGRFVFIEFFQPNLENHEDFMRIVNQRVSPCISKPKTHIVINLYDYKYEGSMTMCLMIAQETQCPYDSGGWNEPFTFKPENNIQHRKVLQLCRDMELTIVNNPLLSF